MQPIRTWQNQRILSEVEQGRLPSSLPEVWGEALKKPMSSVPLWHSTGLPSPINQDQELLEVRM